MTASPPVRTRRRYDSELRRNRAAETRERIVSAGAELLRDASIRDWGGVTIRAVAERAGVNERTVYRHFANERALRDAVMQRLEADAGIDLAHMQLEDIGEVTARIFRIVSAHPLAERPPLDPTLLAANRRQHDALLAAVSEHAPGWRAADRRLAAAMFDTLWALGAYERLVAEWDLDPDDAIRGIAWVIGLVEAAVRDGDPPPRTKRGTRGE